MSVVVQLSGVGETEIVTFQSYLVSVQLGNSLIGSMSASSNLSETVCADTSIKNANSDNKTVVLFTWTPPDNLDVDAEVIIR